MGMGMGAMAQPQQPQEIVPKSKLMSMMQILMGRSLTKDEIKYETAEYPEGSGSFVSSLSIPSTGHTQAQVFQSEASSSKKAAEQAASTVAIDALQVSFAIVEADYKARKKQKTQEWLEEKKMKKLEKQQNADIIS